VTNRGRPVCSFWDYVEQALRAEEEPTTNNPTEIFATSSIGAGYQTTRPNRDWTGRTEPHSKPFRTSGQHADNEPDERTRYGRLAAILKHHRTPER
jgi:hypothetical protein